MKKFSFSLERVLDFKEQIETSLRNEHAASVQRVQEKELVIQQMEHRFADSCKKTEEYMKRGMEAGAVKQYEEGLHLLEIQIAEEKKLLEELKREEARKREQVIEAKKETSSIQMLKDKKKREYQKVMTKLNERMVEEFVCNRSIAQRK